MSLNSEAEQLIADVGGKLNYLKKAYARLLAQEGVYVTRRITTIACSLW